MNPNSLSAWSACCRHAAASEKDDVRRQALENCAAFVDRTAEARSAIKAVLSIYEAFPDAELAEVRVIK